MNITCINISPGYVITRRTSVFTYTWLAMEVRLSETMKINIVHTYILKKPPHIDSKRRTIHRLQHLSI